MNDRFARNYRFRSIGIAFSIFENEWLFRKIAPSIYFQDLNCWNPRIVRAILVQVKFTNGFRKEGNDISSCTTKLHSVKSGQQNRSVTVFMKTARVIKGCQLHCAPKHLNLSSSHYHVWSSGCDLLFSCDHQTPILEFRQKILLLRWWWWPNP